MIFVQVQSSVHHSIYDEFGPFPGNIQVDYNLILMKPFLF